MTTATMKLTDGQKHILRLIQRDKEEDGWASVSEQLCKSISTALPAELATFEKTESGGRIRLTEQGHAIVFSMEYL